MSTTKTLKALSALGDVLAKDDLPRILENIQELSGDLERWRCQYFEDGESEDSQTIEHIADAMDKLAEEISGVVDSLPEAAEVTELESDLEWEASRGV